MVRFAMSNEFSHHVWDQKLKLEKLPCKTVLLNNEEKNSPSPGFQRFEMSSAFCTSDSKTRDEIKHAPAGNWHGPDCDELDDMLLLKDLKRSIKRNKSSLKRKKHATMKRLDVSKDITTSNCPVIEQEKKAAEGQSRDILVKRRFCTAIPQDNSPGQNNTEKPKPSSIVDDWLEEELDALWIGVRRHGLRNWDTVLADPMLTCLHSRTPVSLSERWNIERQKILDLENSQEPHIAVVKRPEPVFKKRAPAGAYHQATKPKGFLKILKPQNSFGSSLVITEAVNVRSKFLQSDPHLKKNKGLDKNTRPNKKLLNKRCNADVERERRDDSATESELSLKEWCAGKEVSSDGTISG